MFTKNFKQFSTALCSAIVLFSCTKDLNQPQDLAIDQKRIRSSGGTITLNQKAALGRMIYFDNNMSQPAKMQSCSSCHLPQQGWVGYGEIPSTPSTRGFRSGIGEGAVAGQFGGRKPPSAAYATFAPAFRYDAADQDFVGGLFWDGRATGAVTGNPAADQAIAGPFINPVEHGLKTREDVIKKIIENPVYQEMWLNAWGTAITMDPAKIDENYKKVGLAIAEYEASSEVNQFTSKFDAYNRKQVDLTPLEKQGLNLFNGKAKCDKCHDSKSEGNTPALFTDFGYENIGLPTNIDFLSRMSRGTQTKDLGLGGELMNSQNAVWKSLAAENMGKFKTPTLRNVAIGENNKRFMHNGVLKSLEEVVHFYNTRDVDPAWRSPEVLMNMETGEIGNLGLSKKEELAIVAFLRTLSDGWPSSTANRQSSL
jgi:cytochrome c peroxidase